MSQTSPSLRTQTAQVRHLGNTRSGTQELWHMRVTASLLIPLSCLFLWALLVFVHKDYEEARTMVALESWIPLIMLSFVGVSAYHMHIGMKSIIMDYVSRPRLKEWLLIGNIGFSASTALISIFAILKISIF